MLTPLILPPLVRFVSCLPSTMSIRITVILLLSFSAPASLYNESPLNHTCVLPTNCSLLLLRRRPFRRRLLLCRNLQRPPLDQFCYTYSSSNLLLESTWTLHGLWPDFCNGSFTQYCDLSRQYDPLPSPNTTNGLPNGSVVRPYKGPNIGTFLEPFGKHDLLAYMNKYWFSSAEPNADFWAHEFSRLATCYSTFNVATGPNMSRIRKLLTFSRPPFCFTSACRRGTGWQLKASLRATPPPIHSATSKRRLRACLARHCTLGALGRGTTRQRRGTGLLNNGRTVVDEVWYYYHVCAPPKSRYVYSSSLYGGNLCEHLTD